MTVSTEKVSAPVGSERAGGFERWSSKVGRRGGQNHLSLGSLRHLNRGNSPLPTNLDVRFCDDFTKLHEND